ncbi:hypothetical protein GN958_ATG08003 [Phytophthora infestans]|uniref:Uncharacterized protein n=1 Tax=Phytophthora infestans TaxID=4787 RepID=A0A8S9UPI7_PHYIN|nr:hypothetical protein GN958_ATG08003 [Phytophthora infestans]
MENIEKYCGDSGDGSGDTCDIKPLAYQQEIPRSVVSMLSEKLSHTTAWRPLGLVLVSTHVGFEVPGEARLNSGGVEFKPLHMS